MRGAAKKTAWRSLGVVFAVGLVDVAGAPAWAVDDLLVNGAFEDTDFDGAVGDGWGSFGAAGFNDFFGPNGHASLFADFVGNTGGFFQLGIPGTPGATYQFDLLDTRIESNFDAVVRVGLEYWTSDDPETGVKIGESLTTIDTASRLALPNVDGGGAVNGSVFSVRGTAVPGTGVVRPIVSFDGVNPTYLAQSQANLFVFDSFLAEIPEPGGQLLKNGGFEDTNGDFDPGENTGTGDFWGSFGSAGFNDFFGGNGHVSLFGDFVGNSGGVFQSSQVGQAGVDYRFSLDDVRLEENWDASLRFGLEYYADDNFTKLGETLVTADTLVTGDGLSFEMTGTAVDGTAYVRPVILFDDVNPNYLGQSQAAAFIFDATLAEAVAAMGLAGDFNGNGAVEQGDLDLVLGNWGALTTPGSFVANTQGLTDGVDQDELDAVLGNWGASNPPVGGTSLPGVPEPASAMVLGMLGLALRRRRGVEAGR